MIALAVLGGWTFAAMLLGAVLGRAISLADHMEQPDPEQQYEPQRLDVAL